MSVSLIFAWMIGFYSTVHANLSHAQRIILQKLGGVYFGHGALLYLLEDYKHPNDKIATWLASGELVALRKGLYVLGELAP